MTRPGAVARDIAVRGLLPSLGLLALVVAAGKIVVGPLGGLVGEAAVNQALQALRSPALDLAALAVSHAVGVVGAPLIALVALVVLRRRTGQWPTALLPLVSVSMEALVYQSAAFLVGRSRPVGVEQLDFGGEHFSFPSGHVGATVCLGLVFVALAWPHRTPRGRVLLVVVLTLVVALVVVSRLYLGMHHVSDTLSGALVGAAAAALGWHALRRSR